MYTTIGDVSNRNATDVTIKVSVMELSFLSRDANGSERPSARVSLASLRDWPTFRISTVLVTRRQAKGRNTAIIMSTHTQSCLKNMRYPSLTKLSKQCADCLLLVARSGRTASERWLVHKTNRWKQQPSPHCIHLTI